MNKPKKAIRKIDEPHFTYWQALYMSFYSKNLYLDVAKRWKGYGFFYLLLLVALTCIPLSIRLIANFNQYFDQQLILPLEKMPSVLIQNGEVKFDKPMPYLVKNKDNDVIAIIDTTGQVTKMDSNYPDLTILMTRDKIYFRSPHFNLFQTDKKPRESTPIFEQPINPNTNEIFVGKEWVAGSGIFTLKTLTEWVIYPVLVGFIFSIYFVFSGVFALLGLIFVQMIFHVTLSFKGAYRILVVSETPQLVVFLLSLAFNKVMPGSGFLYVALLALYFNGAILMIKRESKSLVIA